MGNSIRSQGHQSSLALINKRPFDFACLVLSMQHESPIPFDPKLRYRIRDSPWIFIFALYVAGMVFISYCTLSTENINRLMYGYDSDGNICGQRNIKPDGTIVDLTKAPYVFFMNGNNIGKSKLICVSKCPEGESYWNGFCSYLKTDKTCVKGYASKPSSGMF